jgi:type I restriction enzyme R subunit
MTMVSTCVGVGTPAQAIIDWQHKEDVQRVLRRDIKRDLRQLGGLSEEHLNELAASMVEIARRKLAA